MFKQHHFQKSEPKKTTVKIRDRLKVPLKVGVHWDDGSYQEEDIDDLEIIGQKQQTKAGTS